MANPITVNLPADLPTDWVEGQTVAPSGEDVGLSQQHGYNYLMQQVNNAQKAATELGQAFDNMDKKILIVPSQTGSVVYNGQAQSPAWANYDPLRLTLGGTTSGTNAGTYNATFAPKSGYTWDDGTTATKTVTWTIKKAPLPIPTLSTRSITLTDSADRGTVRVYREGDGQVYATHQLDYVTISYSYYSDSTGVDISAAKRTPVGTIVYISVEEGTNYLAFSGNLEVSVLLAFARIYGVSWDGSSSTKLTRTDDASLFSDPVPYVAGATSYGSIFDNILPWRGMQKVTDDAGELVSIPKFWYRLTQNGTGVTIQITNSALTGFSCSPAHMDRGDGIGERDVVFVGRYHCNSSYRSIKGATPLTKITRATARSGIHDLGDTMWQSDFAMRFTIWLLYIVEFADWNSQEKIGYGCGNNSSAQNMGYTDSMPYHTGTTQSSRTSYGLGTQYRYIEGLWDNVEDWVDGEYGDIDGFRIIINPSKFSDQNNGVVVGNPPTGYPSAVVVSDLGPFPVFIPSSASGSATSYIPDGWFFDKWTYTVSSAGGSFSNTLNSGLFSIGFAAAGGTSAICGCRLMKLP